MVFQTIAIEAVIQCTQKFCEFHRKLHVAEALRLQL